MSTRPPVPGTLLCVVNENDKKKLRIWARLRQVDPRKPPARPQIWLFEPTKQTADPAEPDDTIDRRNFIDLLDLPVTPARWWNQTTAFEFDLNARSVIRQNGDHFANTPYPDIDRETVIMALTYYWNSCPYWQRIPIHSVPAAEFGRIVHIPRRPGELLERYGKQNPPSSQSS
ncbi:MAG TPA: hypothetical protein RMG48_08575 [Myxococcales bacterium LLY-WYZ-16_1]|jgi:hypothetical protein|nr:hypothetical protein [Myxococcales bacterium LLY-WYZ-16_1]